MQTELDQHELYIDPLLTQIATPPFVTGHVDSPHTHYKSTFRHPISGLIVNGGSATPTM